jgi:hypothetical protein
MNYNLLWLSILLRYHWLYYAILNIKVVECQYAEITIQTTTNPIRRSIHLDIGKTQTHQH